MEEKLKIYIINISMGNTAESETNEFNALIFS